MGANSRILILLGEITPFASLVAAAAPGSPDLWTHLVRYVLPAAAIDTAVLLSGVGLVTIVICYLLGRRLSGAAGGLVAALLAATYPAFVFNTGRMWAGV